MNGGFINFYELNEVKELTPKYDNPNYNMRTMPLKHPLRAVLCSPSGGGKSNITLNIIKNMNDTFKSIIIFCQCKDEPLYNYLYGRIEYPAFQIYEGIKAVNDFNFDDLPEEQTLIIFDDMCVESEKKQQPISDLFIRGRKMCGGKGISLLYLTQSYFKCPKTIRNQMTNLFIRKINGKKDLDMILRECALGATKEELQGMYLYSCPEEDITQFLFIDFSAPESYRFRKGLNEILMSDDFSEHLKIK